LPDFFEAKVELNEVMVADLILHREASYVMPFDYPGFSFSFLFG
jgi:hypothetical protein